jgi:ABC-type transport system involved in cytochrome c biogenesis permease subunit
MGILTLTRALIILLVFSIVAALITPPDVISQFVVIFEMVIICGFLAFIISRFRSLKQTPESIKNLIIVLVCLLSISISCSLTLLMNYHRLITSINDLRIHQSEQVSSQPLTK